MENRVASARVYKGQRGAATFRTTQKSRAHGTSRALLDQRVIPRRKNISPLVKTPSTLNCNAFTRIFKVKKSGVLMLISVLLISISLVPLSVAFKSYLWERARKPAVDGHVLYDRFITEEFSSVPDEGGSGSGGGYTDYTVPSLKLRPYVVQKGDSLYSISKRYNVSLDSIISVNELDAAYFIQIGKVLRIPNMSGVLYTVRRGDSLSSITARYRVDMNRLVDINDLESSVIYVGQRLFIPGGKLSDWERSKALGTLFVYPVRGRLTSKVGFRIDPFTRKRAYHAGIDVANRIGTSVTAAQAGKVTYVGYKGNYGKTIIIAHQQGYTTLYGHLDKILVKRGQVIRQGERIGTVGNTGRSTGPHLHFEIHHYGKILDPLKILRK
jgi:murein DD-endopeptidase MepM/ murein hydrolase activator NlpD